RLRRGGGPVRGVLEAVALGPDDGLVVHQCDGQGRQAFVGDLVGDVAVERLHGGGVAGGRGDVRLGAGRQGGDEDESKDQDVSLWGSHKNLQWLALLPSPRWGGGSGVKR